MILKFLKKWWTTILWISLLVLPFVGITINNIVVENNVRLVQEWNDNSFEFDYDDDNDLYDCFLNKEKIHVYVTPDNVTVRHAVGGYNNDYLLQQWISVDYSFIILKNVKEYKLVMFLK